MKYELDVKIIKNFFGLKAKTCSYYVYGSSKDRRAKDIKECENKINLKFENYKNCLESTQLENKKKRIEKKKIDIDRMKENHKEFIRNNQSIL